MLTGRAAHAAHHTTATPEPQGRAVAHRGRADQIAVAPAPNLRSRRKPPPGNASRSTARSAKRSGIRSGRGPYTTRRAAAPPSCRRAHEAGRPTPSPATSKPYTGSEASNRSRRREQAEESPDHAGSLSAVQGLRQPGWVILIRTKTDGHLAFKVPIPVFPGYGPNAEATTIKAANPAMARRRNPNSSRPSCPGAGLRRRPAHDRYTQQHPPDREERRENGRAFSHQDPIARLPLIPRKRSARRSRSPYTPRRSTRGGFSSYFLSFPNSVWERPVLETPFPLLQRTAAKRSFADRRSQTEFGNEIIPPTRRRMHPPQLRANLFQCRRPRRLDEWTTSARSCTRNDPSFVSIHPARPA